MSLSSCERGLNGKRVVCLGGTSGIGYAVAERSAREGASVVVVSSRQENVDRAITRLKHDAEGYAVDLTNEAQVRQLFNDIGQFDHLVFSAGDPLPPATLLSMNIDAARQLFNLRYWGALMAAKYGSGHIKEGGSITLVSGTIGMRPRKGGIIGASLSGGTEALTRALAVELAPLRVNAVCLGFMRTEMWNGIPDVQRNAMFESITNSVPAGRVGEPGDAAEAFLYLMREQYSTGQIIVLDGGLTLV
ncbi:SDR family oxidoreductase [Paenibacillus sp. AR247]|uniref:SDR family oxidoreductase n=1 Tax=Paenibacillus sp. AR247 TaxID=1631599 RepID=UPI000CFA71EE|nr:SDR family oxidoreductase [Paenibacillus sp. AR247]PQP88671.1 short-chain dehydrogenase [Paenibacillus sp. AR247]